MPQGPDVSGISTNGTAVSAYSTNGVAIPAVTLNGNFGVLTRLRLAGGCNDNG